jgi:hypothetical protein
MVRLHVLARAALALAGRTSTARKTLERAIHYVNDVGLYAEEVDEDTGELLGDSLRCGDRGIWFVAVILSASGERRDLAALRIRTHV